MNGRQAARKAAKQIEELELVNMRQSIDIKDYNACILDLIAGGSPCKWCEDQEECQRDCKGYSGCTEWWLRYRKAGEPDGEEAKEAESPVSPVQHMGQQD